jgi:hypothetical protein
MKICPVGAKLFHADGWTDIIKLTVTFHNFANGPKNCPHILCTEQSALKLTNMTLVQLVNCKTYQKFGGHIPFFTIKKGIRFL